MDTEKVISILKDNSLLPSKKELMIISIALILSIVFFSGYDFSNYIHSAAVNENDGGFAFTTRTTQVEVHMYDKSGTEFITLCFDNDVTEGGTAVIWFDGNNYKVFFYRPNLCLTIDNEGDIISEQEIDHDNVPECWAGWKKKRNSYTYEFDGTIYCYNEESYFSKRFLGKERSFVITSEDGISKTVWTQNENTD